MRLTLYALAALLTRLADEGARVALVLVALARPGGAALGGAMAACLLVPHMVAAPVLGGMIDRARRPYGVIITACLGFATALAFSPVVLGHSPGWPVLLVLLAGGCCGPALTGGLSSQLAATTSPDHLPRAYGLDSLTYNVAGIVGPSLASLLAAATTPAAATALLAGCAAAGAVLLIPLAGITSRAREDLMNVGPVAGVRFLLRDPVLRITTMTTSAGQLGLGALPLAAALLAAQHHSPAATGELLTTFAAGGLVGSLVWTARPATPSQAPMVSMVGLFAMGLPLLAAAAMTHLSLVVTMVLYALAGAANGPLFGAVLTTRNDRSPEPVRGQVFTLAAGIKLTATAIGSAAGGLAASRTSLPLFTAMIAAWPLAASITGAARLTQIRGAHPPGSPT